MFFCVRFPFSHICFSTCVLSPALCLICVTVISTEIQQPFVTASGCFFGGEGLKRGLWEWAGGSSYLMISLKCSGTSGQGTLSGSLWHRKPTNSALLGFPSPATGRARMPQAQGRAAPAESYLLPRPGEMGGESLLSTPARLLRAPGRMAMRLGKPDQLRTRKAPLAPASTYTRCAYPGPFPHPSFTL